MFEIAIQITTITVNLQRFARGISASAKQVGMSRPILWQDRFSQSVLHFL